MSLPTLLGGRRSKPAAASSEGPAYYEVWAGLERANRALWAGMWLSFTFAMAMLVMLRLSALRPPIVIRVDGSGQAQIMSDLGRQSAISEAEVRNFLTLFEKFFTELNCYTYASDLKLAFSMMTPEFQAKANELLKVSGSVETLKANQAKITLTLTEIKVLKDTPQVLECRVKGYRSIDSYKTDGTRSEVVFEDDIVLRKVARSAAAPYGVVVQDWTESVFKR